MRGAPQLGFSRHILWIRSRVSPGMPGRPGCPCRTFRVHNSRKPLRCQATTVSGFTMTNVEGQSRQRRERETQKRRSPVLNFARFLRERRSTSRKPNGTIPVRVELLRLGSNFSTSISGTGFRFPLACKFALLRCARLRRRCRLRVSLKQSPLSR
jgi:hypothetical protein